MKYLISILLALIYGMADAQQLSIGSINPTLLENANVVIRNSELTFKVINEGRAIKTNHLELTILNESGKRESEQYVHYSSLVNIISFSGEIYDKYGSRVKKIKKSEVEDVSSGGGDMYSDDRYKVLDFSYPTYPYTLVFDYTAEHDGLMFYPYWFPQDHPKTSIEHASLTVSVPESIGINYFENKVKVETKKEDVNEVYTWEVENIPGFSQEPYGPSYRELVPFVLLTPKSFEMEGYRGSMTTWNSIGQYENALLKKKDVLPEKAIQEIENEIKGISDKREIAKRVYEYVQNTTRYVSVQLGIGGWQPYDAAYVYENGYGDCKALTNYTHALLKQVGVSSIYTNVFAGNNAPDIITDFPNSQFNHIILAVPFEKDTVWLECTSQTKPFGYTGHFTSDRHVLLITEEGGVLTKTPTFTKDENTQIRTVDVEISKNGSAVASIKTNYSGLQYENVNKQLYRAKDDQKKWLTRNFDLNKVSIVDYNYEHSPGVVPKISERIELTSTGFGSITGNRVFFEVNPLNQFDNIPKKLKERESDIYLKTSFTDIDSINYKFPEGYHIEFVPEDLYVKTRFGEYHTTYERTQNGLIYVRKLILEQGQYPASAYNEFRDMLKTISKSDMTKIVLVGST